MAIKRVGFIFDQVLQVINAWPQFGKVHALRRKTRNALRVMDGERFPAGLRIRSDGGISRR